MSLKQKALSGVKWTGISSLIIAVIQLLQLSILAHYLEPTDFGLMAIVTVIIGFSALFLDLGISASIIHRQDITHVQLSSLYWLNVISGILLFLLIYTLAPFLSNFYNDTELIPIIRILALNFIISSFGSQYGLLFQKTLKFDIMAKISIASVMVALVVAVSLAMNGFGVYAFVNRIPFSARRSILGVCKYSSPIAQLMASANCWSVIMITMLGFPASFPIASEEMIPAITIIKTNIKDVFFIFDGLITIN